MALLLHLVPVFNPYGYGVPAVALVPSRYCSTQGRAQQVPTRSEPNYSLPMKICFLFLSWIVSSALLAQVCGGNLGENIFTDGDFGRGLANTLPNDPGIAPGYVYTPQGPPFDGFYTVTNNTSNWPGLFGTWLGVGDNSPDPNGYMMVVNASLQPGLFYEQEVDGLCENTFYQFTADIINLIRAGTPNHIDPNVSFLLNGNEEYATGLIPKTNTWNTYGFTFTTLPGQTSVTLSLRNNAPGGNGNDLAIDNISFRACGPLAQILPETVERICEDGQFTTLTATIEGEQYPSPAVQWQTSPDGGNTWIDLVGENDFTFVHTELASGFYYYRYLLANGAGNLANERCRVVSNEKIVEVVPKFWMVNDTICQGRVYETAGRVYDQSGVYVDTLLSSLGCDSIVTLQLTVEEDPQITLALGIEDPACVEDFGRITIDSISGAVLPYQLSFNGAEVGQSTTFTNLQPGEYALRLVDRIGCSLDTVLNVAAPIPFVVDLGPDRRLALGESVLLTLNANAPLSSSQWIPEVEGCGEGCRRVEILPTGSGTYTLLATSEEGCLASDSLRISVEKVRRVYIPTAFSPNFDGVNDFFAPLLQAPNVQAIQQMKVFNRWGGLLYEARNLPFSNTPSYGWDGTSRGKAVAVGTYTYVVDILFLDGESIRYSGDVTLLR